VTLPLIAPAHEHALFLDFDGTLVDIAYRPDAIALERTTVDLLDRLERRFSGALAIVSGRAIADIDTLLAPKKLAVAGVHGLVRRDARGRSFEAPIDAVSLKAADVRLRELLPDRQGLLIETKPGAIALHFRARPALAKACLAAAQTVAREVAHAQITEGKMVVELKFGDRNKGSAIREFLAEPPFQGRRAIFAGDDATDEDGFAAVNELGGISIKIGGGDTLAVYRALNTREFLEWAAQLADERKGAA
jgi:trehalose 6-phosphate phosphatase